MPCFHYWGFSFLMPLATGWMGRMQLSQPLRVFWLSWIVESRSCYEGHEVSHIRNYDIRISTIAVALARCHYPFLVSSWRDGWCGGEALIADEVIMIAMEMVWRFVMLVISLWAIVLAPRQQPWCNLPFPSEGISSGCIQCGADS